jgi:NDP-sugar pyrophosphorylase family protein
LPDQIRCDTINAGIYVLEADTLDRIPADTVYSVERAYFPSLIEHGETFVAHIDRGYWLDIGTPEKYRQAHRDIMDGRFPVTPFAASPGAAHVAEDARIETGAVIEGPCFIDRQVVIKSGARIGPYSVIGHHTHVGEDAVVEGAIVWPNTWIDRETRLGAVLAGRHCHFGRNVECADGRIFGDKSVVTDYSRL